MSIVSCDLCGGRNSVKMVLDLLGYKPGIHLCEVCRGCFWAESEVAKSESGFIGDKKWTPGFLNQWLVPHLLD